MSSGRYASTAKVAHGGEESNRSGVASGRAADTDPRDRPSLQGPSMPGSCAPLARSLRDVRTGRLWFIDATLGAPDKVSLGVLLTAVVEDGHVRVPGPVVTAVEQPVRVSRCSRRFRVGNSHRGSRDSRPTPRSHGELIVRAGVRRWSPRRKARRSYA